MTECTSGCDRGVPQGVTGYLRVCIARYLRVYSQVPQGVYIPDIPRVVGVPPCICPPVPWWGVPPCICTPCTTLGTPTMLHPLPHCPTRTCRTRSVTALTRGVVEVTVRQEPLTVLSPVSLLVLPPPVSLLVLVVPVSHVIPYGRRSLCAECPPSVHPIVAKCAVLGGCLSALFNQKCVD